MRVRCGYSSVMVNHDHLRPIERRIRRLVDEGAADDDIARRFRRSPAYVRRVLALSDLPGRAAMPSSSALRPLERRILRWREQGAEPAEIGPKFRRSSDFVERVEGFARYKLSH